MKGRLFPVSMLVLVAVLILAVPALAAGKPTKLTFTYTPIGTDSSGRYICNATSCGTYTAPGIDTQVRGADSDMLSVYVVGGNYNEDVTLLVPGSTTDGVWVFPPAATLTGYIPLSYVIGCVQVTPEVEFLKSGTYLKTFTTRGSTITICNP